MQTRVGLDEHPVHLVLVAGHHDRDVLVAFGGDAGNERVDRFLAEPAPCRAALVELVRLVDEEHLAARSRQELLHVALRAAERVAEQLLGLDLDELAIGEQPLVLEEAPVEARNGRLSGAGVAREHGVEVGQVVAEPLLLASASLLHQRGEIPERTLHVLQPHQLVERLHRGVARHGVRSDILRGEHEPSACTVIPAPATGHAGDGLVDESRNRPRVAEARRATQSSEREERCCAPIGRHADLSLL